MISLIFGLILGIAHYFSDKIHIRYIFHKVKFISFAAGISIAFFIYHFIIGISLTILMRINFIEGILFFIPLFFHTTTSSVSMNEIGERVRKKKLSLNYCFLHQHCLVFS